MSKRKTVFLSLLILFVVLRIYLVFPAGTGPLPIPRRTVVSLPPVLYLTHLTQNVLGTQAIEPTDIIKYVNVERNRRGIKSLISNYKLNSAAKMRADVILAHQNFSHQDPYEGIELVTVLPKVSYYYSYASENIGMGGISGEDFVGGFMNSYSHRNNLLNPDLHHTGVAVVTGPYKQYYVNIAVQLFGIPASKDAFYGYTESDRKKYKKLLSVINLRLNPVVKVLIKPGNLTRQKEIITSLLAKMDSNEPFTQKEIDLVSEYNNYL